MCLLATLPSGVPCPAFANELGPSPQTIGSTSPCILTALHLIPALPLLQLASFLLRDPSTSVLSPGKWWLQFLPLGSLPFGNTHERVNLPLLFDLVLGHAKIPSPISKLGGRFFTLNSGFPSVLQAVWNRAVMCSHSTWLKNVRNVELYFPPPSLPAFSFLTLFSGEVVQGEFSAQQFSPSVLS